MLDKGIRKHIDFSWLEKLSMIEKMVYSLEFGHIEIQYEYSLN
eukprot:COSAG01_NODE_14_length_41020_cov_40.702133_15_plen_43_part_00